VPRRLLPAVVLAIAVASAGRALADGAFPDELQVFVPAGQPNEIILAANFGLLESQSGGQSWIYVCEAQAGASGNVNLYQMGPDRTLLGDAFSGLYRSTDLACTWSGAGGTLAATALDPRYVYDAAFDPNNPGYVLALSYPPDAGGGLGTSASAIFPSSDDAATFGPPVYSTPSSISGIEFSISSPGLVYATGNEPQPDGGPTYFGNAFVMVGVDGGLAWGAPQDHPELNAELAGDAGPDAGPPPPPLIRLAAVDPVDPQTVYFTLTTSTQTYLAVTHDGGKTIQVLFLAPETITAFLRAAEGTLYVGTRNTSGHGGLFAAPPDGGPFEVVHQACSDGGVPSDGSCDIHVRALAERAGLIYACGDNWVDHMALGDSPDNGVHFTSLLQFIDISGLGCTGTSIEETCGPTWSSLEQLFGIDAGVAAMDGGSMAAMPQGWSCGGSCSSAGGGGAAIALLALLAVLRRKKSPAP
jgi:MYXO-CTERM domain-containing protein